MSDEDAPQKQIPFDELKIVHVQSQDTDGNRRTRRSRWMSEFPAESSALGVRNNPQKQMLGCVGVNEFKCIHEPDLTSQLAAMWEVSHGGAPARAAKVLPLSRIWLPASCEGCLCHCLCNPTFLTYCLAVMWEDVARLKGPPPRQMPLNVLQFAGVFIIHFDQL
ncbi:GM19363 [Drosophila sechellia]|uniref:GM19363 n=1 Tax=Drosophila sechellia TaxID=7238 RepID=B4HVJ8_DROSE|nr:GM19363 [Drosophila sechellia]